MANIITDLLQSDFHRRNLIYSLQQPCTRKLDNYYYLSFEEKDLQRVTYLCSHTAKCVEDKGLKV